MLPGQTNAQYRPEPHRRPRTQGDRLQSHLQQSAAAAAEAAAAEAATAAEAAAEAAGAEAAEAAEAAAEAAAAAAAEGNGARDSGSRSRSRSWSRPRSPAASRRAASATPQVGGHGSGNGSGSGSGSGTLKRGASAARVTSSSSAAAAATGGSRGGSSPTGSWDEAAADASFRDAMRRKGLSVVDVEPDGNCLFRSVSHQIYGDAERHYTVRKSCVEHMSKHKSRFGVFVAEDFVDYLFRIRQPGVWGDDLEIRWAGQAVLFVGVGVGVRWWWCYSRSFFSGRSRRLLRSFLVLRNMFL